MARTPYPPYQPNTTVDVIGGFRRTCLVIDLCTVEPLTSAEVAQIEDQLGLVLTKMNIVYRSDIVNQSRFTKPLRTALQLSPY
jgi:hypothetical protein